MQRCPYLHEMKERLLIEYNLLRHIDDNSADYDHNTIRNIAIMSDSSESQNTVVARPISAHNGPHNISITPVQNEEQRQIQPLLHNRNRHSHLTNDDEEICSFYHHKVVKDKNWPKNAKTSLFIIMSFLYAKLLIVTCIGFVIGDILTHSIPLYYYDGFFTYLYGMAIIFLLYIFCFLLQESTCCLGQSATVPVQKKSQSAKLDKDTESKKKKKANDAKDQKKLKDKKDKAKQKADKDDKKKKNDKNAASVEELNDYDSNSATLPLPPPPASMMDVEAGTLHQVDGSMVTTVPSTSTAHKRKTSQNFHNNGSVFLRIGAIVFGLGTMIYIGLELGSFFEIPFDSACHQILRGINPGLQMIFTFMQMYFIFMNARLNIHRFKLISRFGLMHIVATNICIWIKTLVHEYLKDLTYFFEKKYNTTLTLLDRDRYIRHALQTHIVAHANGTLGRQVQQPQIAHLTSTVMPTPLSVLQRSFRDNSENGQNQTLRQTLTDLVSSTANYLVTTTSAVKTTVESEDIMLPVTASSDTYDTDATTTASVTNYFQNLNLYPDETLVNLNSSVLFEGVTPAALTSSNLNENMLSCNRINIMGTIVQDSAPYLYPFIINYCLIGAVVIYVMWKQIGRYQRPQSDVDLEHKLEVMLSRRAVAIAQASQSNRVDCVGTSKGLFFGLLILVGATICLILFFVLIHQPDLGLLAIYLAEGSHCAIVALSIVASLIGFIRIRKLKFRVEQPTNLNDILLRISAFGLFVYMAFNIISGSTYFLVSQPDLLIVVTATLTIVQVVLQLLFIGDVSRRRVHLPEHDRSKPGRQIVTFLLIANLTLWIIYTFDGQKVDRDPIQLNYYGYISWTLVQKVALPLTIFHRFHSAVTLAEIWKTSYKAWLD